MHREIQILALIQFLIVGLSHFCYPRAWAEFFIWLRGRGYAGVFVHGFLSLALGSLVVAFHQVWAGPAAVLTVVGYIYLFKAALCFLWPATQMATLGRVSVERTWVFMVPGVVYILIAGVLMYALWEKR
ncbi:MAG: hypothetical protein SFX18_01425 [Pirellulales bacterium]|nr:hypothetical protein [Pirellulales bacterium]